MESTGVRNKIQVSQTTADALIKAGKQNWVTAREDAVAAKGKGVLKTFWVNPSKGRGGAGPVVGSGTNEAPELTDLTSVGNLDQLAQDADAKTKRLVEWMVELLLIHVKKMVSPVEESLFEPFFVCGSPFLPHFHSNLGSIRLL
jgi:hypothetical protein